MSNSFKLCPAHFPGEGEKLVVTGLLQHYKKLG